MSILLEALRKSENSQKPVEPPTIHDNDHLVHEPGSIKSSYVVLLIGIALIVIGWLLWNQYHAGDAGYRPPVSLPTGKAKNRAPEVPGRTQSEPAAAKQTTEPTQAAATEPGQTPANAATGRPRTPVESYQEMTEADKDVIRAQRASIRAQKMAADNKASRDAAAKAAAAKAAAAKAAAAKAAAKPESAATKPKSGDEATGEYQSPEPAPIGYWELPDSVRNGVPEIKFSVLVYATNPKDRFVLVNGARLVESDELKPGVVVEEIRRDGVIFSYRMYRFFVEQ